MTEKDHSVLDGRQAKSFGSVQDEFLHERWHSTQQSQYWLLKIPAQATLTRDTQE